MSERDKTQTSFWDSQEHLCDFDDDVDENSTGNTSVYSAYLAPYVKVYDAKRKFKGRSPGAYNIITNLDNSTSVHKINSALLKSTKQLAQTTKSVSPVKPSERLNKSVCFEDCEDVKTLPKDLVKDKSFNECKSDGDKQTSSRNNRCNVFEIRSMLSEMAKKRKQVSERKINSKIQKRMPQQMLQTAREPRAKVNILAKCKMMQPLTKKSRSDEKKSLNIFHTDRTKSQNSRTKHSSTFAKKRRENPLPPKWKSEKSEGNNIPESFLLTMKDIGSL